MRVMSSERCPHCGARVFACDPVCVGCGANLHVAAADAAWEDTPPPATTAVGPEPKKPAPQHWRTVGSLKPLAPLAWLAGAHQALAWLISLCTRQPLDMQLGHRSMWAVLPWSDASNYQAAVGSFEWCLVPVLAVVMLVAGVMMWTGGADAAISERPGVHVGDARWLWRFRL